MRGHGRVSMLSGATYIAKERKRLLEGKKAYSPLFEREKTKFTADENDARTGGELSDAALCYVLAAVTQVKGIKMPKQDIWPFPRRDWQGWEPEAIDNLIRAGGLIALEIDRLQREMNHVSVQAAQNRQNDAWDIADHPLGHGISNDALDHLAVQYAERG